MPEQPNATADLPDAQLDEVPEYLEDQPDGDAPAAPPPRASALRFARMSGSSIAGRDAAAWVTDFLNAAYYRHPVDERDVEDMRLAFSVLTTYWHRKGGGRRLHLSDLAAFHRAFGAHRFDRSRSEPGLLSRAQLLDGAATGSPRPTPTTSAAAGASRSRWQGSGRRTTRPGGWRWRASARSRRRACRPSSRSGTPIPPSKWRRPKR
jgi:hypothetical protein